MNYLLLAAFIISPLAWAQPAPKPSPSRTAVGILKYNPKTHKLTVIKPKAGQVSTMSLDDCLDPNSDTVCEKNQLYSIQFSHKKTQPAPIVSATPSPTPIFTPPVLIPVPIASSSELSVDYSKAVMQVQEAWAIAGTGSRDVIVEDIDTGVDVTHPDLKDNLWRDENGTAGVGMVDGTIGVDDDNGHGTHTGGSIAALYDGGGISGIAPSVRLLACRFMDASGMGDTASAAQCIRYGIDHGAKVMSMSWGGPDYSDILNTLIQEALSKGIIVVAAAGNSGLDNALNEFYPANYDGVISVGSTDSQDALSSFSNFNPDKVFIAAPGSGIYSTYLNGGYAWLSGTSMATPQVAAIVALMLSHGIAAKDIKQKLCDSADKILLAKIKCGRVNARKAVM